ncbi:MAG TPA: DUF2283 domain-containing protein [Stellaceae bacterium]|nr:DUF2283 domain-containing protein [Stellaceae bacterium]
MIRYYPETDTMAIEIRPWPEGEQGDPNEIGGEDAGEDLVIHYAADGLPWLCEIEHASSIPSTSPPLSMSSAVAAPLPRSDIAHPSGRAAISVRGGPPSKR